MKEPVNTEAPHPCGDRFVDDDGRCLKCALAVSDEEAAKGSHTIAALRATTERLCVLLEGVRDAAFTLDDDGGIYRDITAAVAEARKAIP